MVNEDLQFRYLLQFPLNIYHNQGLLSKILVFCTAPLIKKKKEKRRQEI